jgi:FkbM family methyltransferase
MKRLIRSLFDSMGFEIRRKKKESVLSHHSNHRMLGGLSRWKESSTNVNTVVDVGAAAGTWSVSALAFWPNASYLLFEPLAERKVELEALVGKQPNFYFVPCAAGREEGEMRFIVSNDLDGSGVASTAQMDGNIRSVRVTSISDEVKKLNLRGPYIIKLDTHGFEIPILEGCKEIIDEVSLFIIECYGFQIADNSLLFWEMCAYMDKMGFGLVDLVDVMNRPKDGAFWQCDAFFKRKDDSLFLYKEFR